MTTTQPTVTLEFTPPELRLVREAVHAFLDTFSHDEPEVHAQLRAVLVKIAAAQSTEAPTA